MSIPMLDIAAITFLPKKNHPARGLGDSRLRDVGKRGNGQERVDVKRAGTGLLHGGGALGLRGAGFTIPPSQTLSLHLGYLLV